VSQEPHVLYLRARFFAVTVSNALCAQRAYH